MVRRLVMEHRPDASIEERAVAPGEEDGLRFLGSPTVQAEGVDIEPAARERADFAMSCRVYSTPDGLPSEDMLLTAMGVDATTSRASAPDRSGLLATGGSVLTAILSSACCWLPLLLLAFGASAAGASAFFERWRPLFAGVAIVLLGVGFWSTYLRRATCSGCACGTSRGRAGVLRQVSLWISAVVVTAFVLFPRYASVVARAMYPESGAEAVPPADAELVSLRFDIEGMACEACATTLEAELRRLPGVLHASVDYATGVAEITAVERSAAARVRQVVERHGWRAAPE